MEVLVCGVVALLLLVCTVCGCVIVTVLYSVFDMFICCPSFTGLYVKDTIKFGVFC